jgi:hypothetical protein
MIYLNIKYEHKDQGPDGRSADPLRWSSHAQIKVYTEFIESIDFDQLQQDEQ